MSGHRPLRKGHGIVIQMRAAAIAPVLTNHDAQCLNDLSIGRDSKTTDVHWEVRTQPHSRLRTPNTVFQWAFDPLEEDWQGDAA